MRELVVKYLSQGISRRGFVGGLTKAGLTATAAQSVLSAVTSVSYGQGAGPQPAPAPAAPTAGGASAPAAATAVSGVKPFQGPGGAAFAEQLIACGVKYVFGNSASEDAQFYEALVDRPQLKYILTPHEGPGAAMAAGYIKASGEPTIVMQAAVVGMANAIGQMFNAFKEQTPLVVYSYRTDQSRRAGRDGFEEVPNQEQIVQPITKYTWLARRPDMIPETIRRGDWEAYLREVEFDGGTAALDYAVKHVRTLERGPDYEGVPMLRRVLSKSTGVIVHSHCVEQTVRDAGFTGPVAVIPHGAWLPDPDGERFALSGRLL